MLEVSAFFTTGFVPHVVTRDKQQRRSAREVHVEQAFPFFHLFALAAFLRRVAKAEVQRVVFAVGDVGRLGIRQLLEARDRNDYREFEPLGRVDGHYLHGVEVAALFDQVAVLVVGRFLVAGEPLQVADKVVERAPVIVQIVDGVVADLAQAGHALQPGNIHQAVFYLRVVVDAFQHFGVTAFQREGPPGGNLQAFRVVRVVKFLAFGVVQFLEAAGLFRAAGGAFPFGDDILEEVGNEHFAEQLPVP